MALKGMVDALRRAGHHVRPGGALVSIQPHRTKRPRIAITARGKRIPVVALINPAFEPYLSAADAALRRVVLRHGFALIGAKDYAFRVRLSTLSEFHAYLDLLTPRPRFPAGGRQRLHALWNSSPPGTRIEVTEWMAVTAMQVPSRRPRA